MVNLLPFDGILITPIATITTSKCLVNSIFSTPNAKFLTAGIKDFFLNNTLPKLNIPHEIIDKYNLSSLVEDKYFVYIKIVKRVYGLKQASIIAHQELTNHLAQYGYHPVQYTLGL